MTTAFRCGLHRLHVTLCALALLLAGCAGERGRVGAARPEDVRARIVSLLPASTPDRDGWAADIETAFRIAAPRRPACRHCWCMARSPSARRTGAATASASTR
jgi:hypothetical protein